MLYKRPLAELLLSSWVWTLILIVMRLSGLSSAGHMMRISLLPSAVTLAIFFLIPSCGRGQHDQNHIPPLSQADILMQAVPCSSINAVTEARRASQQVRENGITSYSSSYDPALQSQVFVQDGIMDYRDLPEESENLSPLSEFRFENNTSPLGSCIKIYASGPSRLDQLKIPREAEILEVRSPTISTVGDISQYSSLRGIMFVGAPIEDIETGRYPRSLRELVVIRSSATTSRSGNFSEKVKSP